MKRLISLFAVMALVTGGCGGGGGGDSPAADDTTGAPTTSTAMTTTSATTTTPAPTTPTAVAETTTSVTDAAGLSVECNQLAAELGELRQERLDAVGNASVEQLEKEGAALESAEYGGEPPSDADVAMDPEVLTRRLRMDDLWEEAEAAGCAAGEGYEFLRSFCARVGRLSSNGPAGDEILRRWLLSCAFLLDDDARIRLADLARSDGNTAVIEGSHGCTPVDIAVAPDAVWATGTERAWLIDPDAHGVVGRSRYIGAWWVAADVGEVWFSNIDGGYVTHLDWEAGTDDQIEVGANPTGVAVTDNAVWVSAGPGVVRLDRATHEIVAEIALDGAPTEIVVAAGSVWVLEWSSGAVYRIDPATNLLAGDPVWLPSPYRVDMVADGTDLWVADETGNLLRISSEDGAVVATVATDAVVTSLAAAGGFVWASTEDGEILRIDPTAGTVEQAFSVDGTARAIGADDSRLWVLWYPDGGECRVTSFDFDSG